MVGLSSGHVRRSNILLVLSMLHRRKADNGRRGLMEVALNGVEAATRIRRVLSNDTVVVLVST